MRNVHLGIAVFFGMALAAPLAAINPDMKQGTPVQFQTTIDAVRVVPAGDPMPGLHISVKVKGRDLDVYVAPMSFVTRFEIKLEKGQTVQVEGAQFDTLVLAKVITTGTYEKSGDRLHPNLTFYLRDDNGPFWVETAD